MKQMHNFNAGPCVLPREAVEAAIAAIQNFDNTGIGILEISHMMEHIGNTTKGSDDRSQDLVDLIMLNNFKFPLATKTTTLNTPPTTPDEVDPNQPGQGEEDQGGSAD